jgi:FHA domain-containing protein/uncharacterized protein DUF1707
MRASDAERDQAVDELRDRFAEGRISQDTFLYRMDAALRAKNQSELSDLFRDLPGARQAQRGPRQPVLSALTRFRQAAADLLASLGPLVSGRQAIAGAVASRQPEPLPLPLCLPPHADGRFTIGRALACDFTLADLSVSRWHAKLHREDERWMLSDLGSTNGTRLNGWRVTTGVPVRPGDRVTFGSVSFVITDRPVPAA